MAEEATIADAAGLSVRSFQQCLELSATVPPRELSLVEDQFARFSLWAANIGVFAEGRASMDHRLREAPEVQEVVNGLLEALNDRVQDCFPCLKSLAKLQPNGPAAEQDSVSEKLHRALRAISGDINLLHRLSNTIRRASKESQNLKAAISFKIQDEEGNDVSFLLRKLFSNYVRDKFTEATEFIRLRLASTMLIRRKRILYRRSRFGGTSIKVAKTNPQPEVKAPLPQAQPAPINLEQSPKCDKPRVILKGVAPSQSHAAASATTLAADKFNKASAPSVISTTKTVALDKHEELVFPPPPLGRVRQRYRNMEKSRRELHRLRLEALTAGSVQEGNSQRSLHPEGVSTAIIEAEKELQKDLRSDWEECLEAIGEVTCPFCFYAIPALDANDEKKWKAHVKNDLDAYVCLFNECETAEELYSHGDQWLEHMREHALRWRCNSKSHGTLVFNTRDKYVDHMRDAHNGAFTNAQLEVLADKNARTIGPLFTSCPLCGISEIKDGKLEDHIVGHLRFLALKSLPPYEDEGSEDSDVENGSSAISKPQRRSTIHNDPDRLAILHFDDIGENAKIRRYDDVYHNQAYSSSYTSPYMEWGGFRNYISTQPRAPFKPPPLVAQPLLAVNSWAEDYSSMFVEMNLFDGVPATEWRQFEWGFATVNADPRDDHIIQDLASAQVQHALNSESVRIQEKKDDVVAVENEYQGNLPETSSLRSLEDIAMPSDDEAKALNDKQRGFVEALIATGADDEDVVFRDEDYFDARCQELKQRVQHWVYMHLLPSYIESHHWLEARDDRIASYFENAILDGSDVHAYLADPSRCRELFEAVLIREVWRSIFARYLVGLDPESSQKMKAKEKSMPQVEANKWRVRTLTAISKQPSFPRLCRAYTESVGLDILDIFSTVFPPRILNKFQISLRKVLCDAIKLSIEMRTQPAEYMVLPPLQPEYDANGNLVALVSFNASLMNECSGKTRSNQELQEQGAVVRMVLFPLVVKRSNDRGEGYDLDTVIRPAQVLVAPLSTQLSPMDRYLRKDEYFSRMPVAPQPSPAIRKPPIIIQKPAIRGTHITPPSSGRMSRRDYFDQPEYESSQRRRRYPYYNDFRSQPESTSEIEGARRTTSYYYNPSYRPESTLEVERKHPLTEAALSRIPRKPISYHSDFRPPPKPASEREHAPPTVSVLRRTSQAQRSTSYYNDLHYPPESTLEIERKNRNPVPVTEDALRRKPRKPTLYHDNSWTQVEKGSVPLTEDALTALQMQIRWPRSQTRERGSQKSRSNSSRGSEPLPRVQTEADDSFTMAMNGVTIAVPHDPVGWSRIRLRTTDQGIIGLNNESGDQSRRRPKLQTTHAPETEERLKRNKRRKSSLP